MLLFAVICCVFMATIFDAVTFALSATTTRRMTPADEPVQMEPIVLGCSNGYVAAGYSVDRWPAVYSADGIHRGWFAGNGDYCDGNYFFPEGNGSYWLAC